MTDPLRAKAEAICRSDCHETDAHPGDSSCVCRSAIRALREVAEEAAKVADNSSDFDDDMQSSKYVAQEIRAHFGLEKK